MQTAGPALERKGDIAALLTALEPGAVFFVDEIHRLNRALEETFYPAMEDRQLPITIGQGAGARIVTLELPPFTLVGATTRAGLLSTPLRDRFGIQHRLEPYAPAELAQIVRRSAQILDVRLDDEGALAIAAAQPRHAARRQPAAAARARLGARSRATASSARRPPMARCACSRSTSSGSIASTATSSRALCTSFAGGPVGLTTLAISVGEEPDTIEDVYEPYLLQQRADPAHAARPRGDGARLRAPAASSRRAMRRSSEREPRTACGGVQLCNLGAALRRYPYPSRRSRWPTTSSARAAARAPLPPTATRDSARRPQGCSKCGFGFLFELLDDYYPAPDAAFFVCDQQARVIACGRGAFELTGLADERVIGRPVRDVLGLELRTTATIRSGPCWNGGCARSPSPSR